MKLTIQNVGVACFLIVALSIAYYLVIFLPKQAQIKNQQVLKQDLIKQQGINEEKAEKARQEAVYQDCLEQAYTDYKDNWDIRVRNSGRADNLLPGYLSNDINKDYQENQKLCVDKYK